jgi:hypothetical protein
MDLTRVVGFVELELWWLRKVCHGFRLGFRLLGRLALEGQLLLVHAHVERQGLESIEKKLQLTITLSRYIEKLEDFFRR